MVRSLKKISLENVCNNLNINFQICENKKFRIPHQIANLIYNFSELGEHMKGDKLKIFQKHIMDLTKVYMDRVWLKDTHILNDHKLHWLYLKNLCMFKLDMRSFRLFTKELTIDSIDSLSVLQKKRLKSFFKNFLVENSITFKNVLFHRNFNPVYVLLKNSLQILIIKNCTFRKKSFILFLKTLFILKNLKQFQFSEVSTTFQIVDLNFELSKIEREFGRNLEALYIPAYFILINKSMFQNLWKLKFLRITISRDEMDFYGEIFETLSKVKFDFLKECQINFLFYLDKFAGKFLKFLNALQNLKIIAINFGSMASKTVTRKIFDSLINFNASLEAFLLSKNIAYDSDNYLNFLLNLKHLEVLDIYSFGNFKYDDFYDTSIEKVLENCKDSLTDLRIHVRFSAPYFPKNIKLNHLKKLDITEIIILGKDSHYICER